MGEWSEHFEDFPDENPANYVGNRFDPAGAEALRRQQATLRSDQQKLNAEIAAIIEKHRPKSGANPGTRDTNVQRRVPKP